MLITGRGNVGRDHVQQNSDGTAKPRFCCYPHFQFAKTKEELFIQGPAKEHEG